MPNDSRGSKTQAPPHPLNRMSYQFARHHHHSFKTKWYELLFQIFGRYGALENEVTSLGHCFFLNEDIYRIHIMKWTKYLDPIKVANPFKWLEFLIVASLEMLSFSLLYVLNLCMEEEPSFIYKVLLLILSIVDLVVNIITGALRRFFLAPARYIVRPAIEMAMKYPESFVRVVVLTAHFTAAFTFLLFSGGLPAVIAGSAFLTWTLASKLTAISLASIWLGAMLTKGFETVHDWTDYRRQKEELNQRIPLSKRDQQSGYSFSRLVLSHDPTLEELSDFKDTPLLIWNKQNQNVFIYGSSSKDEVCLTQILPLVNYSVLFTGLELDKKTPMPSDEEMACNIVAQSPTYAYDKSEIFDRLYADIYFVKGHVQKRKGWTKEPTRVSHRVDVEHADVRPLEPKDDLGAAKENPSEKAYRRKLRLSYFFGVEAVVCPNGNIGKYASPAPC